MYTKFGIKGTDGDGGDQPKGGAIALTHPLGATGGTMVSTTLASIEGGGLEELGFVRVCVGTE